MLAHKPRQTGEAPDALAAEANVGRTEGLESMIDELLSSYDQTLDVIRRAVSGLSPEEAVMQPNGVPNHPVWTIGHLVHSAEAIGGELGIEPWLPSGWGTQFGTGSRPEVARAAYPSLSVLSKRLDGARNRLHSHLRTLDEGALAEPLPDIRFRSVFPTVGHAALHILSAHTAFHAGQLVTWRRAMDLPIEAVQ